ncbi:MAG: UDP-galactopyranose mutase [Chloroflexia bacterium]
MEDNLHARNNSNSSNNNGMAGGATHAYNGNGNGNGHNPAVPASISPVHADGNGGTVMQDAVMGGGLRSLPVSVSVPLEPKLPSLHLPARGRNIGTFDYLVVGAGFAGSVLAERLATQQDKKVLVVDKYPHIGGNAYDHYDASGILIHKYGPHIFHTNSAKVFEYLSGFTPWRQYQHRVLAYVDGQFVPMPINLDTVNKLYGLNLTSFELEEWFASVAEPVEECLTSEDVVVSKVGRDLYNKFFRGYTRKQWGLDPSELDASVTSRVPVRTNRDDRYFTDTYQVMPLYGYTKMFEKMLSHPNIKVMLNTDYREIEGIIPYREMIYTGPVDAFFNHRFGKLPYRSLEFQHETLDMEVFQPTGTVNYPNEYPYTRISEFKYLTGQQLSKTSIVYEFPCDNGDPYYPVPRPENAELYKKYQALAEDTDGVYFVGRLATYKYYNMDQVVAQALSVYEKIAQKLKTKSHVGLAMAGQMQSEAVRNV